MHGDDGGEGGHVVDKGNMKCRKSTVREAAASEGRPKRSEEEAARSALWSQRGQFRAQVPAVESDTET